MKKSKWLLFSVACSLCLLTACGSKKVAGRECTIKEWLDSGQTCILYRDNETPGKDVKPYTVYVFKNGTCSRYINEWDITYGELSKMTDDEIASYFEEKSINDKQTYQNHSYEIAVYTDSSGNIVESESILVECDTGYDGGLSHLILNSVTGQATVYDSDYEVIVYKETDAMMVWYRYGGDSVQKLYFDEMNTDGVMVDPKN